MKIFTCLLLFRFLLESELAKYLPDWLLWCYSWWIRSVMWIQGAIKQKNLTSEQIHTAFLVFLPGIVTFNIKNICNLIHIQPFHFFGIDKPIISILTRLLLFVDLPFHFKLPTITFELFYLKNKWNFRLK